MAAQTWKDLDTESKVVIFVFTGIFLLYSYGVATTDYSCNTNSVSKKQQTYKKIDNKK